MNRAHVRPRPTTKLNWRRLVVNELLQTFPARVLFAAFLLLITAWTAIANLRDKDRARKLERLWTPDFAGPLPTIHGVPIRPEGRKPRLPSLTFDEVLALCAESRRYLAARIARAEVGEDYGVFVKEILQMEDDLRTGERRLEPFAGSVWRLIRDRRKGDPIDAIVSLLQRIYFAAP